MVLLQGVLREGRPGRGQSSRDGQEHRIDALPFGAPYTDHCERTSDVVEESSLPFDSFMLTPRVIARMSPAAVSGTNQDHVNLCPTGMKLTATSCPCQAFDLPKIRELRLRALCQRRVSRCGFSGLRQTSDLLVRKYSARPNLTGHAPRPHFELYTRPYWQRLKPEAVWL